MKLNYKQYRSGQPLVILHGLMGSLDNWHTLATKFGERYAVYVPDQRNHGKSPHSAEHSTQLMVTDLLAFIDAHNLDHVILLGHSMGGKVAMQFTLDNPQRVNKLIVADIAPKQYPRGHDDVFKALYATDLGSVHSRRDAEQQMQLLIHDPGTAQFLLKNLERNVDGSYQWKMNIDALHNNYDDMIQAIGSASPYQGPTLFIKGERSGYIQDDDLEQIHELFPRATLVNIANAGHWVHADNPQAFYEAVMQFLQ